MQVFENSVFGPEKRLLISILVSKRNLNYIFELKTKTGNIQNILKVKPARNIVVSWSLNSCKIAIEEEKGASYKRGPLPIPRRS